MSWLDENSIVGNGQTPDGREADDNSPYESAPIEREFVLAPAWRALKARFGSVFKRPQRETAAEDDFHSNLHITEPELHSFAVSDTPHAQTHISEAEQPGVVRYYQPQPEPSAAAPATLPESSPVSAQQFAPTAEAKPHEDQIYTAQPEVLPETYVAKKEEDFAVEVLPPSLPAAQMEETIPATSPDVHHFEPEVAHQVQPFAAANANASDGSDAVPYTAPTLIPTTASPFEAGTAMEEAPVIAETRNVEASRVASAQPVRPSKVVAAAVQLDGWISKTRTGFVTWKKSLSTRRSSSQQELFASPPRSKRDRVWAQTSIAAAAIALAFLMGWTAANSRKPATAPNELSTGSEGTAPAPVQNSPREAIPAARVASSGVTLAPSTTGGVTLAPGGATAQAGGVTLLPSAPVANSVVATEAKPSPARSAAPRRRSTTRSSGHLRRSIDGPDNEVVIHRYPAKSPNVQNTKQTAQLKKYSDAN